MIPKEAYKEIVDYFDLEPTDHGKNKLLSILQAIERPVPIIEVREVIKYEKPKVKIPVEIADLETEVQSVCDKFNITFKQLQSRSRKTNVVRARIYFCRLVKTVKPKVLGFELAKIVNKHHSNIAHYLYHSKEYCDIPPLKNPRGKKYRKTLSKKRAKINL